MRKFLILMDNNEIHAELLSLLIPNDLCVLIEEFVALSQRNLVEILSATFSSRSYPPLLCVLNDPFCKQLQVGALV